MRGDGASLVRCTFQTLALESPVRSHRLGQDIPVEHAGKRNVRSAILARNVFKRMKGERRVT